MTTTWPGQTHICVKVALSTDWHPAPSLFFSHTPTLKLHLPSLCLCLLSQTVTRPWPLSKNYWSVVTSFVLLCESLLSDMLSKAENIILWYLTLKFRITVLQKRNILNYMCICRYHIYYHSYQYKNTNNTVLYLHQNQLKTMKVVKKHTITPMWGLGGHAEWWGTFYVFCSFCAGFAYILCFNLDMVSVSQCWISSHFTDANHCNQELHKCCYLQPQSTSFFIDPRLFHSSRKWNEKTNV